jgi:WD40 repeat protein
VCLDQTARIFDAKTGNCLLQLCHESGAVNSIAIRPDSHGQLHVLTSSGNKMVHLWRTASFSDSNQAIISSEDDLDDLDAVSEKINEVEEENFSQVPLVIRQPIRSYVGHNEPVVSPRLLFLY